MVGAGYHMPFISLAVLSGAAFALQAGGVPETRPNAAKRVDRPGDVTSPEWGRRGLGTPLANVTGA
jgi:hypothetical protein